MSDQSAPRDPKADKARIEFESPVSEPGGSSSQAPRHPAGRFANPPTPDPSAAPAGGYGGYGGYGDGYGGGPFTERGHLMDYVRILHKRRWIAITAFVLVFGIVMLYTFTATPNYEARVQILIENENPNVVKFEEVYEQNKATNDYYQTQYRILQSRLLARRTLDVEKLWDHELFVGTDKKGSLGWNPREWLRAGAGYVRGLFKSPTVVAPPDITENAKQSPTIDAFLGHLSIAPVRNSRLVDVKYESPDPNLSARVANALAKQYIAQNLEFKYLASQEATEFLNERMTEQRKSLEQSELALQKYREQTGAVALEDRQNIVVQRLTELNAAVTKARTDRIEKEAVYNQIRAVQSDRAALDTVPAILSNTFIQQLKVQASELQRQQAQLAEKLGDRHPEMQKVKSAIESTDTRINAEIQKIVQALRNDYQAAVANERALMGSLDQQRAEAQELNRASIQYGVLQRDTTSNRVMFEGLMQRSKETGISGELKTSNIRIIDQAEPPRRPSSPNKTNNALLALLGGALLGIGLAFFFEYLDSRLKSPEEIKQQLGLAFLGMIPAIDPKSVKGMPLVSNGVPQQFAEAFRAIRTNVLFSSAEDGPKSIVVTSTAPGEGKTVVSANLALCLALAGQRVLLIDADMRRPRVHELFHLSQQPGLSNVIVGNGKASDAVKRTSVENLWLMPAGLTPPNPAELLGSRRFATFLNSLFEHFDWVILDSPPVMAVTDASVVSHIASGVVFVVGAEMTSRGGARAALDQLDSAKAKYVGCILNKVDLHRNAYYYSHYYKRQYKTYYADAAKA